MTNAVESIIILGHYRNWRSAWHIWSVPSTLDLVCFWIDWKLLDTMSILKQKEWTSLSNFIWHSKFIKNKFYNFTNKMDFTIIKPVVNYNGLVPINNNRLFWLCGIHSTKSNCFLPNKFSLISCEVNDIHLSWSICNHNVLCFSISYMPHQSGRRSWSGTKSPPIHFLISLVIFCAPVKTKSFASCIPSYLVHVKWSNHKNTSLTVKSKWIRNHFVLHINFFQTWALYYFR